METERLESRRGRGNSRCSGEMRRDREEHRWRKRSTGRHLTLTGRKLGERMGLDTPVVLAVNDGY